MKRLLVPYDKGAVHPAEIARALGDTAELVFGIPDSEHAKRLEPVMAAFGRTMPFTHHRETDRLAAEAQGVHGIVAFSELMVRSAGGSRPTSGCPVRGSPRPRPSPTRSASGLCCGPPASRRPAPQHWPTSTAGTLPCRWSACPPYSSPHVAEAAGKRTL